MQMAKTRSHKDGDKNASEVAFPKVPYSDSASEDSAMCENRKDCPRSASAQHSLRAFI